MGTVARSLELRLEGRPLLVLDRTEQVVQKIEKRAAQTEPLENRLTPGHTWLLRGERERRAMAAADFLGRALDSYFFTHRSLPDRSVSWWLARPDYRLRGA